MDDIRAPERIGTVVIGGGQSGLSVGYHLARRGLPFVILDASARVGVRVAPPVGLAAAVHARALLRAGGYAVPGATVVVHHQGHDG